MVDYHAALRTISAWEPYLMAHSGLPGPRANLELMQAVADLATAQQVEHLLEYDYIRSPANTPGEFLAACGTAALGRLLVEGQTQVLDRLKTQANDPRWRVREAAAMALQRLGDADMATLLTVAQTWAKGSRYEQRAAAAAVCEPRLLRAPQHARAALDLLDAITRALAYSSNDLSDGFETLRKGLGYCWSVAVAALPGEGQPRLEAWAASPDKHIRWIVRENLKKNRLIKIDPAWVERVSKIAGA